MENIDLDILEGIISFLEKRSGLELASRCKSNEYVENRWAYYKVATEFTNLTFSFIAKKVSRDHSTLIHSLKSTPYKSWYNTYYDCVAFVEARLVKNDNKQLLNIIDCYKGLDSEGKEKLKNKALYYLSEHKRLMDMEVKEHEEIKNVA